MVWELNHHKRLKVLPHKRVTASNSIKMAMTDIFTLLVKDREGAIEAMFDILNRDKGESLKRWAKKIEQATDADPARVLLHHLVEEDKTTILLSITRTLMAGNDHIVFGKIYDDDGEDDDKEVAVWANTYDLARYYIANVNCDDLNSNDQISKTLDLYRRWLMNDREDELEVRLIHMIASRFWRETSEESRDVLRGVALYAHARHFYYDGRGGVRYDEENLAHGVKLELATDGEFDGEETYQSPGSSWFNWVPRVPFEMCESRDMEVMNKSYMNDGLLVCDFEGNGGGVAIVSEMTDLAYFMLYPEEYERGAQMVFDHFKV